MGLITRRAAGLVGVALLGAGMIAGSACGAGQAAPSGGAPPVAAPAPTGSAYPSPPSTTPDPEPSARTVDLATAGDEFNDARTLANWSVYQGDLADAQRGTYDVNATTPGALTILPGRTSWVNRTRGFYLYKQVRGDFAVTVRVRAGGRAGALPTTDWSLTGLLLRAPVDEPRTENWIGYTVGYVYRPTIERKTTIASRSVLRLIPVEAGWVELRMVRMRHLFVLLQRYPGRPWTLQAAYSRTDLPETLQVGVNAGTGFGSAAADLISTVDWIRFAPTRVPATARDGVLSQVARIGRFDDGQAASIEETDLIRRQLMRYLGA